MPLPTNDPLLAGLEAAFATILAPASILPEQVSEEFKPAPETHGDEAHNVGYARVGALSPPPVLGFSGAALAVVKGTTIYLGLGSGSGSATEANQEFYVPGAGTIRNLRVYVSASTTGSDSVVTVRKNGVAQLVTLTFGAAITGLLTDLVNRFTVAAGDRVSIEVDNQSSGGGVKTLTVESVSFELAR